MKKSKILSLISMLVVIVCMAQFVACSGMTPSGTNSYTVSIYTLQRSQHDNGEILNNSLQLKRQFMVVRSAAFKLDEATDKNSYEIASGDGKVLVYENEVQVIPKSDMTLLIREGQLKTINLYANGTAMTECEDTFFLESYNNLLVNTYEESFDLNQLIFDYMKINATEFNISATGKWAVDCEFYAHKPVEIIEEDAGSDPLSTGTELEETEKTYDLTGGKKPFSKGRILIENGQIVVTTDNRCGIEMIKSFDVSIKVSAPKPVE